MHAGRYSGAVAPLKAVERVKRWGCGAVGARFLGMEEVAGSIPASSTNLFLYQKGWYRGKASRPLGDEELFVFCFVAAIY